MAESWDTVGVFWGSPSMGSGIQDFLLLMLLLTLSHSCGVLKGFQGDSTGSRASLGVLVLAVPCPPSQPLLAHQHSCSEEWIN